MHLEFTIGLDLRINAKMCFATLSHRQPDALGEPTAQSLLYMEMCATLDYRVY